MTDTATEAAADAPWPKMRADVMFTTKTRDDTTPRTDTWAVFEGDTAVALCVNKRRARWLAKKMGKALAPRGFRIESVEGGVRFGVAYDIVGGRAVESSAEEGSGGGVVVLRTNLDHSDRHSRGEPLVPNVPEFAL